MVKAADIGSLVVLTPRRAGWQGEDFWARGSRCAPDRRVAPLQSGRTFVAGLTVAPARVYNPAQSWRKHLKNWTSCSKSCKTKT